MYEIIKGLAVDYRFKPGERINEVELASRLDVSRTPVREALNRLVRDGFLSFVPNKGFYARDITPEGVCDLYELRAAVERAAFRLACDRAGAEEIEQAVAIWETGRNQCPGPETAPEPGASLANVAHADEAFHMAIVKLSKNSQMVNTLTGINERIRFFRQIDLDSSFRRANTFDEHAAIIAALRRRDAEVGSILMERHITLSSRHAVEVTKEGLARIFFGAATDR